jgi:hypothetical protein
MRRHPALRACPRAARASTLLHGNRLGIARRGADAGMFFAAALVSVRIDADEVLKPLPRLAQ